MMDDDMKPDMVLGKKYRVVKKGHPVVGILTHIELDMPAGIMGPTGFTYDYLELTEGIGGMGDPYTAKIYGPWDRIEPVTNRGR